MSDIIIDDGAAPRDATDDAAAKKPEKPEKTTGGYRAFACLEGNEPHVLREVRAMASRCEPFRTLPGLVIVRDPELAPLPALAEPLHPFLARAELRSFGEVKAREPGRLAIEIASRFGARLPAEGRPATLHVWAQAAEWRASRVREARRLERLVRRAGGDLFGERVRADDGALVADVICTDHGICWIGAHRHEARLSRWPGGMRRLTADDDAPSRGQLKLEEALEWAALPLTKGDIALDLGCAPGGWSAVLLACGLVVHGVDKARVDERVVDHPGFQMHATTIEAFGPEPLPRVDWLFCDVNGPANATLDAVLRIARTSRGLRGMLVTVKIVEKDPLSTIKRAVARVRDAGFADVRVRHLYHNRGEVSLVATKPV